MSETFFLEHPDPIALLELWLEEVESLSLNEPKAMVISSVDASSRPDSRVVLLRGLDSCGLRFFTNYKSAKAEQFLVNDNVSVNFYWDALKKQVRIAGDISRLPEAESDTYWQSRPRASQISQTISQQSQVVASRKELETQYALAEQKFASQDIPRPKDWGGYLISPKYFEFWVADIHRFHDRYVYQKHGNQWQTSRLYP